MFAVRKRAGTKGGAPARSVEGRQLAASERALCLRGRITGELRRHCGGGVRTRAANAARRRGLSAAAECACDSNGNCGGEGGCGAGSSKGEKRAIGGTTMPRSGGSCSKRGSCSCGVRYWRLSIVSGDHGRRAWSATQTGWRRSSHHYSSKVGRWRLSTRRAQAGHLCSHTERLSASTAASQHTGVACESCGKNSGAAGAWKAESAAARHG